MHSHLGVLGVTGFLMQNLTANPLDYVEGGQWDARRIQLSEWLDSTNPDLRKFAVHGGKMIVTIGTNDTPASPGAQLDYYQSVIDRMGQHKVDEFARFFVIPQANHGLAGTNYPTDADGKAIPAGPIPNTVSVDGLGGEEGPARQATHGDRRRAESSPLPLSDVSEIQERSAG